MPCGQPVDQLFSRADKNGDGKLTKDEAPERLKEHFDRADSNHDGKLTADERIQMQVHTVLGADTLRGVAKQYCSAAVFLDLSTARAIWLTKITRKMKIPRWRRIHSSMTDGWR